MEIVIAWLRETVDFLGNPIPCVLRGSDKLESLVQIFYESNLKGDYSEFTKEVPDHLRISNDSSYRRYLSLPEEYGIADLLGGGSFDPCGFCYVLAWSPTAHIAVLGQQGQFWSLSEPIHNALQRFVVLKQQFELGCS